MRRPTRAALALALALGLAPAVAGAHAAGTDLSGTAWQLVAIQSMDDAQGTTRVASPSRFTLEFGSQGRAVLRLDCNRGVASYQTEPAAAGRSGALSFGPIAGTRARCAPPHLDERVVRDLAFVRSYLLKDGKLFLSLMADGGIYVWAPLKTAAAGTSDAGRIAKPVRMAEGQLTQRVPVALRSGNVATSLQRLPRHTAAVAKACGDLAGNRFEGLLPDDGICAIGAFLVRSAGRRDEAGDFTLSVGLQGAAPAPVSADSDAMAAGTRHRALRAGLTQPPRVEHAQRRSALQAPD